MSETITSAQAQAWRWTGFDFAYRDADARVRRNPVPLLEPAFPGLDAARRAFDEGYLRGMAVYWYARTPAELTTASVLDTTGLGSRATELIATLLKGDPWR